MRPQRSQVFPKFLGGAANGVWGLTREELCEEVAELVPVNRLGERTPERLGEIRDAEFSEGRPRQVDHRGRPQGLDVRADLDAVMGACEEGVQQGTG